MILESTCTFTFTKPHASLAHTLYTQTYVQDDARRVSREHRDVVTLNIYCPTMQLSAQNARGMVSVSKTNMGQLAE